MGTKVRIYPDNPSSAEIQKVVECLEEGGVIIYPTDTLYGFGCAIDKTRSVERIIRLKGLQAKYAKFSFICSSIKQVSRFARVSNSTFRVLRANLPGPFTFILPGLSKTPDYFIGKRKTVGIRIPSNPIPCAIVEQLGIPILTTSLPQEDDSAYVRYPDLMAERWGDRVDMIIDGGEGGLTPSTVVDCTGDSLEIIRRGLGELKEA